jgi:hypothetical protein
MAAGEGTDWAWRSALSSWCPATVHHVTELRRDAIKGNDAGISICQRLRSY